MKISPGARLHMLADSGTHTGPAASSGPQVAGVHPASGGSGASTLAAEIAWVLAMTGRRVAAIDADLDRGCLHYKLDFPVSRSTLSLADVLPVLGEASEDTVAGSLGDCPSGACLLPAPQHAVSVHAPPLGTATRLVGALRPRFDHVVIDTGPSLDGFTSEVLAACDVVIIVAVPELACLGGARKAVAALRSAPAGAPSTRLVVNRSLGQADLVPPAELESFLGIRASAVLQEDAARCRRLANECRAICSDRSPLAREMEKFITALFG